MNAKAIVIAKKVTKRLGKTMLPRALENGKKHYIKFLYFLSLPQKVPKRLDKITLLPALKYC